MFGLTLPSQLIQGSAVRTWNCVAHYVNLLWYKFYQNTHPTVSVVFSTVLCCNATKNNYCLLKAWVCGVRYFLLVQPTRSLPRWRRFGCSSSNWRFSIVSIKIAFCFNCFCEQQQQKKQS